MLGKLTKYEFKYMARIFPLLYVALVVVAAASKLFFVFSDRYQWLDIMNGFSIFAFVILLMATMVLPTIMLVMRFYKSMVGDEGYLTFTLPVAPYEILLSKLINAALWTVFGFIAIIASISIFFTGVPDLWKDITEQFEAFGNYKLDLTILIVELIITAFFAMIAGFCHLYAAMSVGQTAGKYKIGMSVGAYFGIYFVLQILQSLLLMLLTKLQQALLPGELSLSGISVLIGIYGLYYVIISVVLFFISSSALTKRLNLE